MENRTCLICEAPIPPFTSRLCIEACRACASFFKRTKTSGRKYTCRQGDENCSVVQGDKYMCRSCRYAKCIMFGMELQPRNRKPKLVEVVEVEPECASTSTTNSAGGNLYNKEGISTTGRMETHYKSLCERRLIFEKEYVARHSLKLYNHAEKKFYIANFNAFCDLYRITIKSLNSLLSEVFEDFDCFSTADQAALYKNFILKFTMTEGVYFSSKYFRDSDTIFVSSMITCSDVSKKKTWNDDDEMLKNDSFRRTAQGFGDDYMDLFEPMSKMNALTEREFYALAVLNYCDIDSLSLPEEIVRSTRQIRARVFEELQDYYRNEMKLSDFSQRLGTLMTLAHGAGEAGLLLNEEMRMYATMFDVHTGDRLLREFFTE